MSFSAFLPLELGAWCIDVADQAPSLLPPPPRRAFFFCTGATGPIIFSCLARCLQSAQG